MTATAKSQKKLLREWASVPVGTLVIVTKDDGREVATHTRSAPEMMGTRAVIWLDGISGCYALERVRLA